MKRITGLNHTEARQYFLKEECYYNFDLPKYFNFQSLLDQVSANIAGGQLSDFLSMYTNAAGKQKQNLPCDFENVNYKFLNNKDGKYAWRPFQLIHPILYVHLVHKITDESNWNMITTRFAEFGNNPNIICCSIPVKSEDELSDKASAVSQWWQLFEQKSLELALKYEYVIHTDISDCYGSIYTHSVPWALHTRPIAKSERTNDTLIGNVIDKLLRHMSYGQTNGIPQGSVLMDFIAEMILGAVDLELSTRIQEELIVDYQITRYRDDYRIFSNNPQVSEHITKLLTEILIEFGMRLNAQKTLVSDNVVRDSIKPDKLFWIASKKVGKSIQEHLLLIYLLSEKYPNSGSLSKSLTKFYERIKGLTEYKLSIKVLVSILVDIMYKNPRTYPIASAILSKLLSLIDADEEKNGLLQEISSKFAKIPNTGHLKIWMQRLTIKFDTQRIYDEVLCKKVNDSSIKLWNSDWLIENLCTLISTMPIIDLHVIETIDVVIDSAEVELFESKDEYNSKDE